MYIKKSLVLSLFLCLIVSSAYASNVGRHVYGVLAESVSGVHFNAPTSDADSIHLYVWEETLGTEDLTTNALEGLKYTRLTWGSKGWTGCGWTSTNANGYHNMSEYYGGKIKFLVRSSNSNVLDCRVGIEINGKQVFKTLRSLGFNANGQWQELTFNLDTSTGSDLTAANLEKTTALFIVSQNSGTVTSGNIVDVDYVRWIKSGEGSFNVTVKNVSGNSTVNTSTMTWASSNFQSGWKVADQYLEIDYDKDSSTNDWNVRLYVDNGSKDRNGLYATKNGEDYIMTMCWRASEKTLPYSDSNGNHTLQIAEGYNSSEDYKYLYDSGSASSSDPVWLYMQDLTDLTTAQKKDYSTVMGYKTGGYHIRSGVYGGGPGNNGYESGSKVALYLGANCDVAGGLKYEGNIVVELEYE